MGHRSSPGPYDNMFSRAVRLLCTRHAVLRHKFFDIWAISQNVGQHNTLNNAQDMSSQLVHRIDGIRAHHQEISVKAGIQVGERCSERDLRSGVARAPRIKPSLHVLDLHPSSTTWGASPSSTERP